MAHRQTDLGAEAGQENANAHNEGSGEGDELDIVDPADHRVDEDASAPGETASDGPDEGHQRVLPFRTFDVGLGRRIEFLELRTVRIRESRDQCTSSNMDVLTWKRP